MRVLHISWRKRSEGELGGVEKFAHYLKRVVEEEGHSCQIVAWSDYPGAERAGGILQGDKALLLGSWAEEKFSFDVAVSDGYWGAGITGKPVVPVVHGTWAQFHINMRSSPWTNREVAAQHDAFNAPNAFPVAVSPASARELQLHHGKVAAATILHGIDTEEFCPLKDGSTPPIVLHAATNAKKGKQIMPAVARELGADFRVQFLGAKAGEEPAAFQRGEIFFHPSQHEGNAYALLEAMAVALPIVTTPVGLFESIEDGLVGRVLPPATTVRGWAAAIKDVWGDGLVPYRGYAQWARKLALNTASLEAFKGHWLRLLTEIIG
jgi:hypothetical protein